MTTRDVLDSLTQAFFGLFEKNSRQKKLRPKKNSSKSFQNSIICQLKTYFLLKKVLKMIYLHKNLTKLKFFYLIKLKIGKIQGILGENPFFWVNSSNSVKNSRNSLKTQANTWKNSSHFPKNSRFCQVDLVFITEKRPKKSLAYPIRYLS